MANIDNRKVFRKNRDASHHNTHFIVYRAWVLYQARGDASKIFKIISKLHFDEIEFCRVEKEKELSDEDEAFLKRREQMIKRCLALLSNFISQYKLFCERFMYKRMHLKEYLQQEMDRVKELYGMHDKFR